MTIPYYGYTTNYYLTIAVAFYFLFVVGSGVTGKDGLKVKSTEYLG